MASKKKRAAKAGAGAVAASRAARSNPYVQRLVEDDQLRDNLRTAYESARKAYERMSNGKGPAKALLDDKKTQRELREAASSLREAADSLRGTKAKKHRRRRGRVILLIVAAGAGDDVGHGGSCLDLRCLHRGLGEGRDRGGQAPTGVGITRRRAGSARR